MSLLTMLFIIIICLSSHTFCFSQSHEEVSRFESLFDTKEAKSDYSKYISKADNELQVVLSGVFLFYKQFFSSQDANKCVFSPSCSVYAMQSLQRNGVFVGLLDTFDRLSRCNTVKDDNYPVEKGTNLLHDPVE